MDLTQLHYCEYKASSGDKIYETIRQVRQMILWDVDTRGTILTWITVKCELFVGIFGLASYGKEKWHNPEVPEIKELVLFSHFGLGIEEQLSKFGLLSLICDLGKTKVR